MFFILFFLGLYFLSVNLIMFFEFNLFNFNSFSVVIVLLFDWMSLIFIRFVLLISSRVILYSKEYISLDKNIIRFIFLVFIFIISIIFIIISPNLIRILLGWDGLGLISYCLVIYYENEKSYNSGILTFLRNRIGDVALLISIVWILNFGGWNFLFYLDFYKTDYSIIIVCFLVVLASITKSAQIPFSSWLPAAIAAPTPVSSLVHSSTLVTAGVYLMIRFSCGFNEYINFLMLFISIITIFISGLRANFEFDLKKIIALSTLSQLGLIIRILFLGDYQLSFFHLLVHALFKALLFICAGLIIHIYMGCQDIRLIGGLVNNLPLTSSYFIICNLSLCGLPFFSGFYSKDLIVEVISFRFFNLFIYMIYMISIGLTVRYTIRLLNYLLFDNSNNFSLNIIEELFSYILQRIIILIFFVVFSGSSLLWLILNPYYICLPLLIKVSTLLFIILGILMGNEFYNFKYFYNSKSYSYRFMVGFIGSIWIIPNLFTVGVSYYPNYLIKIYYNRFDQGWFEYYGSKGLFNLIFIMVKYFQYCITNFFKLYLSLIFIILFYIFLFICLCSLIRA